MGDNLSVGGRAGVFCLSKAGLAIGSTATGVSIAAPNGAGVDFCIDGTSYHLADAATVAITAATAQGLLTTCLYLVTLNSSGTLATVKGTAVLSADLAAGNAVLEWPVAAASTCPIGAFRVVTASTANFTAGTTDLDASNVTTTYIDLFSLPARPLTA